MVNTQVLTMYDDRYFPIMKVAYPAMEQWASHANFSLYPRYYSSISGWDKLKFVREALLSGARAIWLDCDILICDVYFQDLPTVTEDIAFSVDSNGMCTGAFIAHGKFALGLVTAAMALPLRNLFFKKEQDAIKGLLKLYPELKQKHIPTDVISNPETGPVGKFAHHIWAGDYEDKQKAADELAKLL